MVFFGVFDTYFMQKNILPISKVLPVIPCYLVNFLLFAIPLFSLTSSKTTSLGIVVISIIGIFYRAKNATHPLLSSTLIRSLVCLAVVTFLMSVYHQEKWGVFHLPLAILISLPAYWALQSRGVSLQWALWGSIVGAFVGVFIAINQGGLDGVRVGGVFNPIPFGGMAMFLAFASGCAFLHKPSRFNDPFWFAICLSGFLSGIAVSLLSSSKAGWLALIFFPLIFLFKNTHHSKSLKSIRIFIYVLLALVVGFITLASSPVGNRVTEGFSGFKQYIVTGKVVEGSIGPRLELWKYGLNVVSNYPVMGVGKNNLVTDMHERVKQGEYDISLASLYTLHNEFLHIFAVNGFIGFAAMVWVYISLARIKRIDATPLPRSVSNLAISLCSVYLALGVGEVAIQLSDLRNFFLFWAVLLAAQQSTATHSG